MSAKPGSREMSDQYEVPEDQDQPSIAESPAMTRDDIWKWFLQNERKIVRTIKYIFNDKGISDYYLGDALDDTLIGLIENISKYDPTRGRLIQFVNGIARNKARDVGYFMDGKRPPKQKSQMNGIRREQQIDGKMRKPYVRELPDISMNEIHGRRNFEDRIEDVDEAAMRILPPHQREVLRMKAIEDKTYEQIAKSLGITKGNARKLYSRGCNALRKHFGCAPARRKRKGQHHLPS